MPKFAVNKAFYFAVTAAVIFLNASVIASAVVEDGFGASRKIEGRYFTVYYAPQLDPLSLSGQLDIGAGEKVLAGGDPSSGQGSGLAEALDTLFTRVCGILDMQLYSYQGSIKVCANQSQLAGIYRRLFDRDPGEVKSFYVYELNTIYTSAENFRRGIIGHEIGHAIMSHYFVVQPPVKIQEVLAGYVEYQLRKPTRN
ncbi:MAG: hypothetical protein PHC33_01525 [Candidatus Omnitrophica bacterium]|nr:hypothetical protein [Candidatus Omnitrophota bacterium]